VTGRSSAGAQRAGSPAPRTIAEHAAAVLARVAPLPPVELRLADAATAVAGLVLAGDVVARAAVPPFDNAAMDGYAVRLADLPDDGGPVTLPVSGDVRCGWAPGPALGTGPEPAHSGAVRIMTGAPLPAGADAVVPVECTSTGRFVAGEAATERMVTVSRQPRTHVRRQGEDVRPGDVLARAGDQVSPAVVAVAAAAGLGGLAVHRRPRVAVVSTGSELVASGAADVPEDGVGIIPDSNSLMLAALAHAAGADVLRIGAVPDDADALRAALDSAVALDPGTGAADLVVTSGGVSAGASDVVREVLAGGGGGQVSDVEIAAVAMRPGRPQALARWRGVPWVAMPGSPVSAFVSFVLFARPAIERLAGRAAGAEPHLPPDRTTERPAATGWASPPGREQVVPVRVLPSGEVVPAGFGGRGSGGHLLSGLLTADGLAIVPAATEKVDAGDPVRVLDLGTTA